MGFHAVTVGCTTEHGSFEDYLDLLFKEIKETRTDDGYEVKVTLVPHDDILIDGKNRETTVMGSIEPTKYDGITVDPLTYDWFDVTDINEELAYYTTFELVYQDEKYPIAQGHCCCYGLTLATVGDDCGGGPDQVLSLDKIQKFCAMLEYLKENGRISSTELSMTGNCCS